MGNVARFETIENQVLALRVRIHGSRKKAQSLDRDESAPAEIEGELPMFSLNCVLRRSVALRSPEVQC